MLSIFDVIVLLRAEGGNGEQGRVRSVKNDTYYRSSRSWVKIEWDAGGLNMYRRGHEGAVDIKCVTAVAGELYYSDHLPKLGNNYSLQVIAHQPILTPLPFRTSILVLR